MSGFVELRYPNKKQREQNIWFVSVKTFLLAKNALVVDHDVRIIEQVPRSGLLEWSKRKTIWLLSLNNILSPYSMGVWECFLSSAVVFLFFVIIFIMSSKTIRIVYRIATALIALFHIPGIFFMNSEMAIEGMKHVQLGNIIWLQQILWYAGPLAALALIVPQYVHPRLKERAYAWLTFMYSGAFWAHFSLGHPISEIIMPLVTLMVLMISYAARHTLSDHTSD